MTATQDPLVRLVLIHGALHGGWCWEQIAPRLRDRGYAVETPDLPGLGADPAPPASVTFEDYVRRIVEVVRAGPGPVLLLGHSMAGGPVSRAAEEAAEHIGKLVYLTAMLPKDGETLAGMAQFGEDSVVRGVRPGEVEGVTGFDTALAPEIFYNTCDPATARAAVARLATQQPLGPLMTPIRLTPSRWGAIPKTYVVCARDRAMPPSIQRWLCERAPEVKSLTLDCDHSPFFSAPDALAALIDAEAGFAGKGGQAMSQAAQTVSEAAGRAPPPANPFTVS